MSAVVNDLSDQSSTMSNEDKAPTQQVSGVTDVDELFQFISYNASTASAQRGQTIEQEIETYVNSKDTRSYSFRICYRRSSLRSGAAVERLFSCAGQILVTRHCKVSDDVFEKVVFLRYKLK